MNRYQKKRLIRGAAVAGCALIFAGGVLIQRQKNESSADPETEEIVYETENASVSSETEQEAYIYVHIAGEVISPGVYKLKNGSRVIDLIQLAGGLTDRAADASVNQAAFLSDGQQIIIPAEGEEAGTVSDRETDARVNINTADEETLMTLNGIGEAKASAIISYREENGAFSDISEIMNVSGIGQSLYEKIKDKIRI